MEAKIIAGLVLIAAVFGFGWYLENHVYQAGYKAGSAAIELKWDQDKADIQKAADIAIAAATKEKEDALANNEGITNDLQAQLSAARTLSNTLAQRLRSASNHSPAGGSHVPEAADHPGAPADTAGPGVDELNAALGAALSECYANRANQIALIKELLPQL